MKIYKNLIISSLFLISIIFFSLYKTNAQSVFKCSLNISLKSNEIESNKLNINNADLVFTVKNIKSIVTYTGWISDGYKCNIGKILKGNINDTQIKLYLFQNSNQSKNLRKLKSNDKLILGFSKNRKKKIQLEGFRSKNGTTWKLLFITQIKSKKAK